MPAQRGRLKVEYVSIDDLVPFAGNPRKISEKGLEKLRRSVEEFGFVNPVLVQRGTNMIIAGHQRVKAARKAGLKEVPAIFLDFDDPTARAYNVADNRLQDESEWDFGPLADLLQELDTGALDLTLTGFDEDEIQRMMTWTPEPEDVRIEEDEAPEPPAEPVTRPGDLWVLGRHRLLCGDCRIPENVDRLFAGAKADSMVTDPPYGVDYSAKNEFLNVFDKGNRIQTPICNDAITDYRRFFAEFLSVAPLADYNTVYIFMSGKELHSLRLAIEDCGYTWGDYLVWVKNVHVLGRKDYNARHEFILYGWRGRHKFYGGFSTTVLEYDKPHRSDLHPTMKPVALVAKLISDGTPPSGIVYDPFCGSGTAVIACEQLGRRCYAMEIEPSYCDVIVRRWEQFTGLKAVRADEGDAAA